MEYVEYSNPGDDETIDTEQTFVDYDSGAVEHEPSSRFGCTYPNKNSRTFWPAVDNVIDLKRRIQLYSEFKLAVDCDEILFKYIEYGVGGERKSGRELTESSLNQLLEEGERDGAIQFFHSCIPSVSSNLCRPPLLPLWRFLDAPVAAILELDDLASFHGLSSRIIRDPFIDETTYHFWLGIASRGYTQNMDNYSPQGSTWNLLSSYVESEDLVNLESAGCALVFSQIGVYIKCTKAGSALKSATVVTVHERSPVIFSRLHEVMKQRRSSPNRLPFEIINTYISTSVSKLHLLMSDLESEILRQEKRFIRGDEYTQRGRYALILKEMKALQNFMMKYQPGLAALPETIAAARELFEDAHTNQDILVELLPATKTVVRKFDYLMARLKNDVKTLLALSSLQSSIEMTNLASINQHQVDTSTWMAVQTKRDSEVMKTISVITMIFLPGTFICTLFSMNIFNFNFDNGAEGILQISTKSWLCALLIVAMTVITLSGSGLWMRLQERNIKRELDRLGLKKLPV